MHSSFSTPLRQRPAGSPASWQRATFWRARFVLGGFLATAPLWSQIATTPAGIRSDLVLRVGAAEISRYAVDKNLTRFRRTGRDGRAPEEAEVSRWFELYLARQVMIAEALRQGYGERPEVVAMVETMARQILAQATLTAESPTAAELQAAYDRSPAPARGDKASFEQLRPALEQAWVQQHRQAQQQALRAQALQAANLAINADTAGKLVERIRAGAPGSAKIPEELIAPLADEVLATYRLGDETVSLTVRGWREHFNRLFVRTPVTDARILEAGVQDRIVADFAYRDALRRGLDQGEQFIEDRRNFRYYQALELFEKEHLLPRIEIAPAEMAAHYREHPAEYSRPVRAAGRLFRFADLAAATSWLKGGAGDAAGAGEEFTVSRERPLPGANQATGLLLRMEKGLKFGPIPVQRGYLGFLKQDTETELQPFPEVMSAIRAKLAQPKLDALEIQLAREWAPRHAIEDRLNPEEFGVVGPVAKPWPAGK